MKETGLIVLIEKIAKLFLAYIAYMLIGIICIFVIIFSIAITSEQGLSIITIDENNVPNMISQWCKLGMKSIPFGDVFSELTDGAFGAVDATINFFGNFDSIEAKTSIKDHSQTIVKSLCIMSLSNLLIFIYNQFKKSCEELLNSCAFKLIFAFSAILVVAASFCFSDCLIYILENYLVKPNKKGVLYIIIIIASCGIHTVSRAFTTRMSIFVNMVTLLLKLGFETIRAIFIYLWAITIPLAYSMSLDLSNILHMFELILISIITVLVFFLLDALEKNIVRQYETDEKNKYPMVIPKSGLPTIYRKK